MRQIIAHTFPILGLAVALVAALVSTGKDISFIQFLDYSKTRALIDKGKAELDNYVNVDTVKFGEGNQKIVLRYSLLEDDSLGFSTLLEIAQRKRAFIKEISNPKGLFSYIAHVPVCVEGGLDYIEDVHPWKLMGPNGIAIPYVNEKRALQTEIIKRFGVVYSHGAFQPLYNKNILNQWVDEEEKNFYIQRAFALIAVSLACHGLPEFLSLIVWILRGIISLSR